MSASKSAAHVFKNERFVSAALNLGKERRVSGAHKNDERTKGLRVIHYKLLIFIASQPERFCEAKI